MSEPRRPRLPIGYWLKRADEAITSEVDRAQEANGLVRLDWQVLNTLHELGVATWSQVAEPLQPFADQGGLEATVLGLAGRRLIQGDGSENHRFRLTLEGARVHGAALRAQAEVRQRAVRGIDEADYATAVRVLQRMVENLTEPDDA